MRLCLLLFLVGEDVVEVRLHHLLAVRAGGPSCRLLQGGLGQLPLQDAAPSVQPRHHRADRDVEDLGRVRVAEVAEIDKHEHVAEVVRHLESAVTMSSCDKRSTT